MNKIEILSIGNIIKSSGSSLNDDNNESKSPFQLVKKLELSRIINK